MLHARGEAAEAIAGATPDSASQNIDRRIDMNGARRANAQRATEILHRASVYRIPQRRPMHQWREAAAALSAMAAAVLVIYFSVAAPPMSFDDVLTPPDSVSETAPQSGTDFLGQQIPSMPAVSSDIAG